MTQDQPAVPPEATTHSMHQATRHMCAGVYLDHTFRERVMRDVYLDRSRQVAPSHGFDAVPVLYHARRATLIDGAQQFLVFAVSAWWLITRPFIAVAAACVFATWFALKALLRLVRDYLRYFRTRGSVAEGTHLRRRRNYLVPAFVVPWLSAYVASYFLRPADLARAETDPAMFAVEVLAVVVSLAAVVIVIAAVRHGGTRQIGSDPTVDPVRGRIGVIASTQHRPVTLYAGYRPFIGAGVEVRTWSFAQRLDLQKDALSLLPQMPEVRPVPRPRTPEQPVFRTVELASHVKRSIRALRFDDDPELRLPNLSVHDHVFVSGGRAGFLVGKSETQIIDDVMRDPSEPHRHYLACRVSSWHGEIVTSVFVHTAIQGNTLYIEFSTWALPPTRPAFLYIDERQGQGIEGVFRAIGRVFWRLPGELARLPHAAWQMIYWPLSYLTPGFERSRLLDRNVGAQFSMREFAANLMTDEYALIESIPRINYFQTRDIVKYLKVIERRLLSSVADYLEARGVETTEYRQRTLAILNQGVMTVGGGSVTLTGSAVGENSSASTGKSETI